MRIEIPQGQMLQQRDADIMLSFLEKFPDQGRLVEIGTGYGHSASFFSKAKPNWEIYTIDSFGLYGDGRVYVEHDVDKVREVFNTLSKTNVIQILGNSNNINWKLPVDVVYLDGGHYYDCVKADFDNYSSYLKNDGYIFLHDYHREDFGVKRLVDELCQNGWELLDHHKVAVITREK